MIMNYDYLPDNKLGFAQENISCDLPSTQKD